MLEVKKEINDKVMDLYIVGSVETTTAPILEKEVKESINDVDEVVLHLDELEYISSAGLRVLLMAKKGLGSRGEVVVKNANDSIMEIFEVTGFISVFRIE
ncbi:MAG: STAS domain-containing protein [Eubacterium sp.]|nr:STAS domain-containing protein [Eubacterium sp.]